MRSRVYKARPGLRTSYVVSAFRRTMVAVFLFASSAYAQTTPPPMESVTLDQAVERALKNNPTVAQAAQGILRAEALLQQARAATMPNVNANFTGILNSSERRFDDVVTSPRMQGTFSASAAMPVLAAAGWAARNQARDQVEVANLSTADVRTNIAVATAQAYLAIIAAKRQVDVSLRARETALAHLDYARRRLEAGAGTRLNELRAAQEVSTDEARLEVTQLAVRIGQEALGVLMASNGPVDAAAEPNFGMPPVVDEAGWMSLRPDLRLFAAQERAADRVWRDSSKDWFPTAIASFDPQALVPASVFTSARGWRLAINFSQPIFDSGQRRAIKNLRESDLNVSRLALTNLQIRSRSEVRLAQDTVQTSERALNNLRTAAQQAQEVLNITNFAFQAGATTNLEVIDAQRQARDADSAAAVAANTLMRAQLDFLTSLGRFPQ